MGKKAECRSIPFADRCGGSAGSECQCIWPAPFLLPVELRPQKSGLEHQQAPIVMSATRHKSFIRSNRARLR